MPFEVEYTDEFGDWWDTLSEHEQDDVAATVELLADKGPTLPFPYCSGIEGSKHSHMRELRIQHAGKPYRCCMHLIRAEPQFCLSEGIKPEMTVGTKSLCPSLMLCMISMSKS